MTNQVATLVDSFDVNFEPSIITIDNYDKLKDAVAYQAEKYKGLIVTEETLKSAKSARAELNKFSKALNERRKEIKREYNQPLKDFEQNVKALNDLVLASTTPIDRGIKVLEAQQQKEREEAVLTEIAEIAESREIDPALIEMKPSWLTKSISGIQRTREIGDAADYIVKERDRIANEKAAVKAYAEANGIEAAGWFDQIDQGASFVELRIKIDDALMARKQATERAQKQKEAEEAIAKMHQEKFGDSVVDTDTGEILRTEQQTLTPENDEPMLTRGMKVTTTKSKMWALAEFMKANGITFESIQLNEEG
ncbi:DUF1351 domain-containing protein [Lacticaseibacillus saniviri]|uniref:Prophage protein n=1 Tax=Lacticaseibacillus saniviri JCM 17471 = DSM 24301 TaxID=1293598 RepID=A0A0R2MQA6_9LACO|nr:DUF1351 domain-containing protein [Lacticaseibacillus saniviri]KRO15782.1 prophage protein [Lacticaseibacillus saniviri JCM 17471 = DSM 24301]